MQVTVKQHPRSLEHWNAIVTTARGRCYYVTYAGDAPSEDKVIRAWKEDRKAFLPYNCITGATA